MTDTNSALRLRGGECKNQSDLTRVPALKPMISRAQNFEDVLLRRALYDIERGFYVDIGAFHPVVDSVTHWFYSEGWRGVNVEPNERFFVELAAARPNDINLRVAIAPRAGAVRIHLMDGLSTTVDSVAQRHGIVGRDISSTAEIEAITLHNLFERYVGDRTVDFFKLDVEGAEAAILASHEFKTVRPRILVIEATEPDSTSPSWELWEPRVLNAGYHFAVFDGLNRFYVRDEDGWRCQLLNIPPNVFDRYLLSADDHRVSPSGLPENVVDVVSERDALRSKCSMLMQAQEAVASEIAAMVAQRESLSDLKSTIVQLATGRAAHLENLEAAQISLSERNSELELELGSARASMRELAVRLSEAITSISEKESELTLARDRVAELSLALKKVSDDRDKLVAQLDRVTIATARAEITAAGSGLSAGTGLEN